jgi:uncharacterized repeat protein (TIGR03803 family)
MRGTKLVFIVTAGVFVCGIKAVAPGASPDASAIQGDSDGMTSGALYGTAAGGGTHGCGVVYKVDATGITVLYTFTCGADGGVPVSGVTHHTDGNLYGTAPAYGADNVGVIYKLDSTGKETVLHTFTQNPDGANPGAGVVLDATGNLYGTAVHGGVHGDGVVFKLEPGGNYITSSFTGADGAIPNEVVRDSAGNLYGTTVGGGAQNAGVVYKMDATGKETVVYSFAGGTDGSNPTAGVVLDSAGNLYGTTNHGGVFGFGVVFKVDSAGKETVLHSFTAGMDGSNPAAGVILDSDGNLYGTTLLGGAHNSGAVYKVESNGKETVLHSFTGGDEGALPEAGVVLDSAGNLYGTTRYGGSGQGLAGHGVVYKLGPARKKLTVLHTFTGHADGGNPYAGVIVRRQ